MKNMTFAFIGVGNISRAVIEALCASKGKNAVAPEDIYLYNRTKEKLADLGKRKMNICESAEEAFNAASVVFFGLKPATYPIVLPTLKNAEGKTLISPAAGVNFETVEALMGAKLPIIRVMPNTPLKIGRGVTAIAANEAVDPRIFEAVCRIFAQSGEVVKVEEAELNSLTALTSSSVAVVYRFIKAICDAGEEEGISYERLFPAICRVLEGSALNALNSGKPIETLIREVASPNGTTERSLKALDDGFDCVMKKAIHDASARAAEIEREISENARK